MKKYLLTGLVILLPLALTIMIFHFLINLLTDPFTGIVEHLIINFETQRGVSTEEYQTLILVVSRTIVLIFLFFFILLLGYLGRKFFFTYFLHGIARILARIPFVRGVYKMTKEVTKALFSEGMKTFQRVGIVPFPHDKARTLGFITSELPAVFKEKLPFADVAVFVPTAPHPFSGFILLTAKDLVQEVDINAEEVFKFLISCGMVHPGEAIETPKP